LIVARQPNARAVGPAKIAAMAVDYTIMDGEIVYSAA